MRERIDLDGLAVGDAQAVDEFALDLEPLEHDADLRPPAVNHDHADADLAQQHHVFGEHALDRRIAHGVAAIFDDEGPARITAHIGQRFGEDRGLVMQRMRGAVGGHGISLGGRTGR